MTVLLLLLSMSCAPAPLEPAASTGPASVTTPDADWLGVIRARIAGENRAIRPDGEGLVSRHNSLGASARFDTEGATLAFIGGPTLTVGLGAGGRSATLGTCQADGAEDVYGDCLRRAEIDHGDVVEWWESVERGFEHGFTVFGGGRELRLDVEIQGAKVVPSGEHGVVLELPDGNTLRYDALVAYDADGVRLRAHMEARQDGVSLVVDTTNARYPVEIDPTLHGDWTGTGLPDTNGLGEQLATGGDIDGDGFSDVIAGVYDGTGYLYKGAAGGPSTTPSQTVTLTTAWDREYLIAMAGDVDGDGFDELLVGDWHYDGGHSREGRAVLWAGSESGLPASGVTIAEGNQTNAYFGNGVAAAGDVNGDGYDDVLIGAYAYDNGSTDEGAAWVYLGSASGLESTAAWSFEGNQATAYFGIVLGGVGDLNGDGFDEIAVSATYYDNGHPDEGQVFVFNGSADGPSTAPVWTYDSDVYEGHLGWGFARDLDANGDGFADLAVGWAGYTNGETNEGTVLVFYGGAGGLPDTASWRWESNVAYTYAGNSIASAGDADGDGDDELIFGGNFYATAAGAVWIFAGDPAGLAPTPSLSILNDLYSTWLGQRVGYGGDLNGDGYDDVVYSAMQYDDGGRLFALFGSPTGYGSPYAQWPWELSNPTELSEYFASSVSAAGDVNGDGFGDVAIGSPFADSGGYYDTGAVYVFHGSASGIGTTAGSILYGPASNTALCGSSIAALGDVEGDGYDDLLVGCPGYESSGGETDEGMVRYYHGTIVGLSTSATAIESNEAYANLGFSVAGVGDVNGDSIPDGAAGAYRGDNGETDEGVVWVMRGESAGLSTSATWKLDSDQDGAWFGYAVAGAGDVDADGYDDVLVGAPEAYDGEVDEGVAWLFRGSSSGPDTTAAWRVGTNQAGAKGADAVAGLGDINGDGYDDVVVGSSYYDGAFTDGGRAAVYLGSASGLSPSASWTFEGEATDARAGLAVAGGGDYDGNGYADLLLSVPGMWNAFGAGSVHLFQGGPSGLSVTAAETWEGDQYGARFGYAIAFARDVDGDGDDEVLLGVPNQDDRVTSAGVARAVYGASVDGDGDGFPSGADCDDTDADISPDAVERCNTVDDDCDGLIDDGVDVTWFTDSDGDGFGDPDTRTTGCDAPDGSVTNGTDCDDTDATVGPCDPSDTGETGSADTGPDNEEQEGHGCAGCASGNTGVGWLGVLGGCVAFLAMRRRGQAP